VRIADAVRRFEPRGWAAHSGDDSMTTLTIRQTG